jgi:O-antigen/teichoic acid export membrane protein
MGFLQKLKGLMRPSSFLSGSLIYILGAVLLKGVSFLLIPLYTSVFTPADYGEMELINTVMALLTILVSFGFSQYLYMEYSHLEGFEKVNFIRKINYSYNSLALPSLITIGIGLIGFHKVIFASGSVFILIIMLGTIYLSFFQNNIYAVLQLDQKPRMVTYNKAVVAITLLIMNVAMVKYLHLGILSVYVSNIIAILLSLGMLKRESGIDSGYLKATSTKKDDISKYVKGGYPFIISSLAYFGINGIDRFLIKSFLGEEELGIYSLAFKFGSTVEPLIMVPILSAYNPMIFKRFSEGNFKQDIFRNFLIIIFIFSAIAFVLPIVAKLFINEKFYESLKLVPIFVLGFAFIFMAQLYAAPLLYLKKKSALVLNVILASIINIILNVVFIKTFQIQGSAFAFLVTNIFWFAITLMQAMKSTNNHQKGKSLSTY